MELWVDKYAPQSLDEYVWQNNMKEQVEFWLNQKSIPHIMFAGGPGSGKTSLAKLILRMMEIPKGDILHIPASKDRQIDTIQNKISNFVSSWALGPTNFKYIILDEADSLSHQAQKVLRNLIDEYQDQNRFILTLNYANKIMPALHSRFQLFTFGAMDYDNFLIKTAEILVAENIEFELETLEQFVQETYPDLRKCINNLHRDSFSGKLTVTKTVENSKDYLISMVTLFKQEKYLEARKLIVSQAPLEEYPEIYRFFYENLDLWGKTQEEQDTALLIIRKGLVNHSIVGDVEINLAATLCELTKI